MKTAPYAVLWAKTFNLGDDIQTIAAMNLLEKNDIVPEHFIDREALKSYEGPEVNLIMNGWFMHDISQFPPPDSVNPVFISFNCTRFPQLIYDNVSYFKKYEPIGCRDIQTKLLLEDKGIDAYFSGCLTLCFNNTHSKGIKKKGGNFAVDAPFVEGRLKRIRHERWIIKKWSMERRQKYARKLLSIYERANLVITSRLHCALPCLAFGTPLIFANDDYKYDPRFSGLREILRGKGDMRKVKKTLREQFKKALS